MARDRRITIFVNDDEYQRLRMAAEEDVPLGTNIRRMALNRADWLAAHGKKQRGTRPIDKQDRDKQTAYNKQASQEPDYWNDL